MEGRNTIASPTGSTPTCLSTLLAFVFCTFSAITFVFHARLLATIALISTKSSDHSGIYKFAELLLHLRNSFSTLSSITYPWGTKPKLFFVLQALIRLSNKTIFPETIFADADCLGCPQGCGGEVWSTYSVCSSYLNRYCVLCRHVVYCFAQLLALTKQIDETRTSCIEKYIVKAKEYRREYRRKSSGRLS